VHGPLDRVKDASLAHATISRACDGCIRSVAHADVVPLLGDLRAPAVIGAPSRSGGYRCTLTDRPRPSFRRRPAKGAVFRRTGMPFTIPTRKGIVHRGETEVPPAFAPALSLTPPHGLPCGSVF
jgi:hypothetical protein